MSKYLVIFLSVLTIFLVNGCGESIYTNAGDTSTKEAKEDELDFNFINGKCAPVVSSYEQIMSSGVKLTDGELYEYISAVLSCSGFDIVRGIDSIANNGGDDIYATSGALMGINTIDINRARFLQKEYSKAVFVCFGKRQELAVQNKKLNSSLSSLCGLAGIMGSVANMSAMMINTSGGGANILELSDKGFQDFANNVIVPETAGQSLASFFSQEHRFLESLDTSLTLGEEGAAEIGKLVGQNNFGSIISDYANKLRDAKRKIITEESILNYLKTSLGIPIPDLDPPVPPKPPVPPVVPPKPPKQ